MMQICLLLSASVCCTALLGDKLLGAFPHKEWQCVVDNATHGLVGALSWAASLSCLRSKHFKILPHQIYDVALCGFIASVIDLDHFVSAKSFSLKAATSLDRRPPLHCTSYWLILWSLCFLVSEGLKAEWLLILNWISIVAVLSHHIRDATRRGMWLWPAGSTPPIPYYLYVASLGALPYFAGIVMSLHPTTKLPFSIRTFVI